MANELGSVYSATVKMDMGSRYDGAGWVGNSRGGMETSGMARQSAMKGKMGCSRPSGKKLQTDAGKKDRGRSGLRLINCRFSWKTERKKMTQEEQTQGESQSSANHSLLQTCPCLMSGKQGFNNSCELQDQNARQGCPSLQPDCRGLWHSRGGNLTCSFYKRL